MKVMNMPTWLLAGMVTWCCGLTAQENLNMTLQDSITYTVGVNDICGWVDDEGNEYALVGLHTGVAIVDIESDTLKEVVFVPGTYNLWRDINTYGHYAYVSSEARVGLQIIDLQYLPDSVKTYVWQDSLPTDNGPRAFEKAHTLWTDEDGFLYLNGSNLNNGGVIILDLKQDPIDPQFLGYAPAIYSHDAYSRDSILYSAEIYDGNLSIYDIHDPANVSLIGRVKTPNEFTHNAWLSDDSRYMFTTDERSNSYVAAYDILDPSNPIEVDRYRQPSTDGSGAIPHNVYVWNDWLVVAYYTSGTTIVDASRPDNLVEVGRFDSYLGSDGGFSGVWGSFPFLPSGKILTSDRNSGLYVFIPNYIHAAFIEGTVIDSVTGLPIQGAEVKILSDEIVLPELTGLDGGFKTGKGIPGSYEVMVVKEGYYSKTIIGQFENGVVLAPVIELAPLPTHVFQGKVIDNEGNDVPFAQINIINELGNYESVTDINGLFLMPSVYEGNYHLQAGIWGQTLEQDLMISSSQQVILQLEKGYKDDFDLDLGWVITSDVNEGQWVRGLPREQSLFDQWGCSSDTDSPFDVGRFLYSTGLEPTEDAEDDEVSGGMTMLSSPAMEMNTSLAKISFDYWLCEFPPNQYIGFQVLMSSGQDTMQLASFSNDTTHGSWQSYDQELVLFSLDDIRIHFVATDTTSGTGDYYLKVHVDNFLFSERTLSTEDELAGANINIYPNPVSGDELNVAADISGAKTIDLKIMTVNGQYVDTFKDLPLRHSFHHRLDSGFYVIHWATDNGRYGTQKIIVLKK